MHLTGKHGVAFNAMDFNWTSQAYATRSIDERIEDLKEYKQTHGHVNKSKRILARTSIESLQMKTRT
jgi:hypothetical protein